MASIKPPLHLSVNSRKWWSQVAATYELEPHHIKLLTMAAEALDRAEEARETITREGAYYEDRFGQPKKHPALSVERDARIQFARLLRELALDVAAPDAPRPPSIA